jgi:16S rRNA (uracil1498-N3)-methyltransferase
MRDVKHRLYLPPSLATPLAAGATFELDAPRTHYLLRVLRLRTHDEVRCFDGQGDEWLGHVSETSSRGCQLTMDDALRREPPPRTRVHLGLALVKSDPMNMAMQKATELGATDLWPLRTQRSEGNLQGARAEKRTQHWTRVIEAAATQCERLHLPVLHELHSLHDFLPVAPPGRMLLLDPGGEAFPQQLPRSDIVLLVGPEGGWSDTERDEAVAAGALKCRLGRLVLRAETVPIAALAALNQTWGWDEPGELEL